MLYVVLIFNGGGGVWHSSMEISWQFRQRFSISFRLQKSQFFLSLAPGKAATSPSK